MSARNFAKAEVDAFDEHIEGGAIQKVEEKIIDRS